jgi:hypothetical protein
MNGFMPSSYRFLSLVLFCLTLVGNPSFAQTKESKDIATATYTDVNGQKLPDELAALIGKKLKPQPLNPKMGTQDWAFPPVNGWKWIEGPRGTAKFMQSQSLHPEATAKLSQRVMQDTIDLIKKLKNDDPSQNDCINLSSGWLKAKDFYMTESEYCLDNSMTVKKYLLRLPRGYGIENPASIAPDGKSDAASSARYQELKKKYRQQFVILPPAFYDFDKCPYYEKQSVLAKASGAQAYGYNREMQRVDRIDEPDWHVATIDEYCGRNIPTPEPQEDKPKSSKRTSLKK